MKADLSVKESTKRYYEFEGTIDSRKCRDWDTGVYTIHYKGGTTEVPSQNIRFNVNEPNDAFEVIKEDEFESIKFKLIREKIYNKTIE